MGRIRIEDEEAPAGSQRELERLYDKLDRQILRAMRLVLGKRGGNLDRFEETVREHSRKNCYVEALYVAYIREMMELGKTDWPEHLSHLVARVRFFYGIHQQKGLFS